MTKPKCHTAVAQRMPVIECLGSEWTQTNRASSANRSGVTTIKQLNLELRLKVWLCIPSGIFYT